MENNVFVKIFGVFCFFAFYQYMMSWSQLSDLSNIKLTLEAQIDSLLRKKSNLEQKIENQREYYRSKLSLEKINRQVRYPLPVTTYQRNLAPIFFITPTAYRPAQKADLTRLSQTLSHIPNLYWVLVEDTNKSSNFIDKIVQRAKISAVHLVVQTPPDKIIKDTEPNWIMPRGVFQRNTALKWIRTNFSHLKKGVIYFGDDDNTYDWRLFDEMRKIDRIGVWPVGIVGGLLVESPILNDNFSIIGFNSIWNLKRQFPLDMAGFAINISFIFTNPKAEFSFNIPAGFQESFFLNSFNFKLIDFEPKAQFCSKVYVWHTRTEKTILMNKQRLNFWSKKNLSPLELDAIQ